MKILVAGGAGYIGSHMCRLLAQSGHRCAVVDDLSTGHAQAVRWGELMRAPLLDGPALQAVLRRVQPDAVMHFAAKSIVGDSGRDPASYYANNLIGTMNLLDAMRECGIGRLVFSSTAAVYGEPEQTPITETHPLRPVNVYGATKLAAERMIGDYCSAYGLRPAKQEFKTKHPPSFREFLDYSRLLGESPLGWWKRLAHRASMLKHYLQHRFSAR